eukprot:6191911-Pleurochrysis_carterae.AAC.1
MGHRHVELPAHALKHAHAHTYTYSGARTLTYAHIRQHTRACAFMTCVVGHDQGIRNTSAASVARCGSDASAARVACATCGVSAANGGLEYDGGEWRWRMALELQARAMPRCRLRGDVPPCAVGLPWPRTEGSVGGCVAAAPCRDRPDAQARIKACRLLRCAAIDLSLGG